MSCETRECGCEEIVEIKTKKSLPLIEIKECGDGSCGCGCVDVSDEELLQPKQSRMQGQDKPSRLRL